MVRTVAYKCFYRIPILHFRNIEADYLREGVIFGLVWLGINILLDVVILIPMAGILFAECFTQTGLCYLLSR